MVISCALCVNLHSILMKSYENVDKNAYVSVVSGG